MNLTDGVVRHFYSRDGTYLHSSHTNQYGWMYYQDNKLCLRNFNRKRTEESNSTVNNDPDLNLPSCRTSSTDSQNLHPFIIDCDIKTSVTNQSSSAGVLTSTQNQIPIIIDLRTKPSNTCEEVTVEDQPVLPLCEPTVVDVQLVTDISEPPVADAESVPAINEPVKRKADEAVLAIHNTTTSYSGEPSSKKARFDLADARPSYSISSDEETDYEDDGLLTDLIDLLFRDRKPTI